MNRKPIPSVKVRNPDRYSTTSRYKGTQYFQRQNPGIRSSIEPETWNPPDIPRRDTDKFTIVEPGEASRLDLVSLRVYKISSLWWVIAYANNIIDPFTECTSGRVLRYPSFDVLSTSVLL